MRRFIPVLLLLLPLQLHAHETESRYDRINLSASAQQQLQNDTLIATLYAEEEGSDAVQLADSVNKKIRWAVDFIKKHRQIKLQTSAYSTSPVYKNNKIIRWRVRQSITLETRDMTAGSELIGRLQNRLALQSMQFAVSPEARTRADDALISEALSAFERRAKLITEQLKRKRYKIVNINISTSGGARPYRSYARAAVMESVAAPAIEAGEQTVQVNVSGNIELE